MFERFTDRARRAVILAQEHARMLGHAWIGTEHLLLGLLAEGEGAAFKALDSLGVSLEAARAAVADRVPPGAEVPGHVPFTPVATRAMGELALLEALRLAHNYVGTEHLLLGLVRDECDATDILAGLSVPLPVVRAAVLELLSGYAEAERRKAAPARDPVPCTRCGGSGAEPENPASPASLTDRLSVITADLEGWLERRAAELARPLIEQAQARADERVAVEADEALRKDDVIAELRRVVAVLERRLAREQPPALEPDEGRA